MKKLFFYTFLFFTSFCFAQTGEEELYVEYKKADTELNTVYNSLKNKLGSADKKALTESQKAWLKFRDLNCLFISKEKSEGGVIANKMKIDCLTQITQQRTMELKELLKEF
jgi:uncharacterized protein YecT (DUF1311 family)